MEDDGIDPKVAAAVAQPSPRRKRVRAPKKTVGQERITEDDPRWNPQTMGNKTSGPAAGYGMDSDRQKASDLLTGRDPDEEFVVRDPYAPAVPASPLNVRRFMEKKRERTRNADQPRWKQEMMIRR